MLWEKSSKPAQMTPKQGSSGTAAVIPATPIKEATRSVRL